jgi:hypothetical protein
MSFNNAVLTMAVILHQMRRGIIFPANQKSYHGLLHGSIPSFAGGIKVNHENPKQITHIGQDSRLVPPE